MILGLTGAKALTPGEILWQEGISYRSEGRQLQDAGDLQRAAAAYRRAISVKPDYAEVYNDLGVVLESLGELDKAEEAYKTALKFKPELGAAHSNLALLYEETNRAKEAAAHWGARVRLGPSDDPWVITAREKMTHHQLPIPETDADRIARKRDEVQRAIRAGNAHGDAKHHDKAIEEFERALRLDPANPEARRLLRTAKTRAEQAQAREARELKSAAGRLERESRREESVRKAEQKLDAKKNFQNKDEKKLMKEARRLEAEKRAEEIAKRKRQPAKSVFEKPAPEAKKALVPAPVPEPAVKAVPPPPAPKAAAPVAVPADALALANQIAKEKAQSRGKASDELLRRATTAMRDGLYQDAAALYQQVLTLEPNNRTAKQGLERAQKALAKEAF